MRGRPLCVALIVWILIIFFFRGYWQKKPIERDGDTMTMICQVEQISGTEDSIFLICKNVYEQKKQICKRIKLYEKDSEREKILFSNIRIGQIIQVSGSIYSFQEPGNPGQFNEFQYNQEQEIDYKAFVNNVKVVNEKYHPVQHALQQFRVKIAEKIRQCCSEKDGGILIAMLLGEKNAMDEEVKQLYQENGIAHVLAISGLHISLIGTTLFFLLRKFILPMQGAAVITIIMLVGYGILIGFTVSATRAIIMMLCRLGARLLGRHYDPLCALGLSAWIQLLLFPLTLFQTGFLLSYGTALGIQLFVKEFEDSGKGIKLFSAVFASLGVQLITLPILLYFYYEIPFYGLVANLLVLPLLGGVLGAGIVGLSLSFLSLSAGQFFMGTVHFILLFYEWLCRGMEYLPYNQIVKGQPEAWQIFVYYCLIGIWLILRGKKGEGNHKFYIILLLAVCVVCFPMKKNMSGLEITNLDVGQGDCTCIRTKGVTCLIDGGSSDVKEVGKYRISKYLKFYGISHIDAVFLTHSDGDHINGLLEMIQERKHMGFTIGTVFLPQVKQKDDNYVKLERELSASDIRIDYLERGQKLTIDDLNFQCLHPWEEYQWKSENDYSLVLKINYKNFSGLFTGDLEFEGEQAILDLLEPVDYLKVSHHGSKGASSEKFLKIVNPKIVVYSAGRNNRYGHPSQETRERIKRIGASEFCTIENGAVRVHIEGEKMWVEGFKGKGQRKSEGINL